MANAIEKIKKEAEGKVKEAFTGIEVLGNTAAAGIEIGGCMLSIADTVKACKAGKPLLAIANTFSAICCFAGYLYFGKQAEDGLKKYIKIK